MEEVIENMVNEQQTDYEKAELDLLRDALKRSDKERFSMMVTLMKLNRTIKRAKITFTPYTLNK